LSGGVPNLKLDHFLLIAGQRNVYSSLRRGGGDGG
jgi:hypothetical protein